MKTKAVVGFLFNTEGTKVVLIKKNKPEHLAGKWNGVGGKIEEGESPTEAMRREFKEEAGVDFAGFQEVAIAETSGWILHYFVGFNTEASCATFSAESEQVERFWMYEICLQGLNNNFNRIWWLVPLLLDLHHAKNDPHKILSLTTVLNVENVTP